MPTVDTPRITLTGSMPAITVNVVTGTSGGGTSVHNQLTGRSAADAHPISAITGLQEALDESGGGAVDSVNGETGTVVLDAADVGAIATSARGNSNGVASLDGDGTVPDIQLPSSIARDSEIGTQISAHDGSGTAHPDIRALIGTSGGGFGDWTVIGNLGATETVTGSDGAMARFFGTVDQACAVTVTLADDQQIDFIAQQDVTGLHAVTFVGVDVWMTSTGAAPSTSGRAGSTIDRFRFEQIDGVTFGYWVTEPAVSSFAHRTSGNWYAPDGRENNNVTTVANRVMYAPFDTPDAITLDRITINVSTGAGSSAIRFGIYSDTGGGKPGALVAEFGTIASTGTGDLTALTISQALQPGRHWLAACAQGGTPQVRGFAAYASLTTVGSTTLADVSSNNPASYFQNGVTGALPSTATPSVSNLPVPRIMVRLA